MLVSRCPDVGDAISGIGGENIYVGMAEDKYYGETSQPLPTFR